MCWTTHCTEALTAFVCDVMCKALMFDQFTRCLDFLWFHEHGGVQLQTRAQPHKIVLQKIIRNSGNIIMGSSSMNSPVSPQLLKCTCITISFNFTLAGQYGGGEETFHSMDKIFKTKGCTIRKSSQLSLSQGTTKPLFP